MSRYTAGPSSEQWAQHRELLRVLYLEQNMSIRRIQEYMITYHGFEASDRMYRLRLNGHWGARKHPKNRASVARSTPSDVNPSSGETSISTLRRNNPSPPNPLSTSSNFSEPVLLERCMFLLQEYVTGHTVESSLWPQEPIMGLKFEYDVMTWSGSLMSAAWVLREGKMTEANALLGRYLRECPSNLARPDPQVFPFLYTSILYFVERQPAIAENLLKVFQRVATTIWGNSAHPLRRLLESLGSLSPVGMRKCAAHILLAYVNMLHQSTGIPGKVVQELLADSIDRCSTYQIASKQSLADLGKKMLQVVVRQKLLPESALTFAVSDCYSKMGDFRQAHAVINEFYTSYFETADVDMIRSEKTMPDTGTVLQYHMHMRGLYETEGRLHDALEASLRSVTHSLRHYGMGYNWTVNTLIMHRKLLEKMGHGEEAIKSIMYRDEALSMLCEDSTASANGDETGHKGKKEAEELEKWVQGALRPLGEGQEVDKVDSGAPADEVEQGTPAYARD